MCDICTDAIAAKDAIVAHGQDVGAKQFRAIHERGAKCPGEISVKVELFRPEPGRIAYEGSPETFIGFAGKEMRCPICAAEKLTPTAADDELLQSLGIAGVAR